jgi:hypothetical protein
MPTLAEDGSQAVPQDVPRRSVQVDDARSKALRDEESSRRHSRSRSEPNSYTPVNDPLQAATAAAHIPITTRPVIWSAGVQPSDDDAAAAAPSSHTPSDYEIFLARAEAEEREKFLRSVYQRSAAYAYSSSHVKPDPHRQFAGGSSPAPAERSDRRNSGSRFVFDGAEEGRPRDRNSWVPSYTTGRSSMDKGREEKKLAVPARRRAKTQPIAEGVGVEPKRSREDQRPTPGTLRRQASFKQRFVEYIRPSKAVASSVQTVVE